MGIRLRWTSAPLHELDACEWTRGSDGIFICCPGCSTVKPLPEHHTVAGDGRVSPVFSCPVCPLIEFFELGGYEL